MTQQDADIIVYVTEHDGTTANALAAHLAVSTRTLRTYVHRINDQLEGIAHLDLVKGGYHLTYVDNHDLDDCLDAVDANSPDRNEPAERITWLLNYLLLRSDWVTIDSLAEALHVSRSTVNADLKIVRERIAPYHLSLETRARYGLHVVGTETDRRICLANNTVANLSAFWGETEVTPLLGIIAERISTEETARCIDAGLAAANLSINAMSYQNLLVHLTIAIMRIRSGHMVAIPTEEISEVRQDEGAYTAARAVAMELERSFDIALPEQEIAYIAIHLAGKQTLRVPQDEMPTVIPDEAWQAASRMIERVWEVFRFDLRDDLELHMNLACHIAPLMVRLRYRMALDNPLLAEIRTRYPLAYSMATEAASILGEQDAAPLSDAEVGYIAMTFELALERASTGPSKKRILVVCASGMGSARMLEHLYRQQFGDCVEHIETCDVAHVAAQDFSAIDYVFTTVPLTCTVPVPVCEVGFFPTSSEVAHIRDLLTAQPTPDAAEAGDTLISRFSPDLFFPYLDLPDRASVIAYLCDRMEATGQVAPSFRELVAARDEAAPTAFGNQVAMPHPTQATSERMFAAVAVLKRPVTWGEHAVRVVIMTSLSHEDPELLNALFSGLAHLFVDTEAIQRLIDQPTWDTFTSLVALFDRT